MPVYPSNIWISLFSNSDQTASEESGANMQEESAIPENEKPVADCNNHESSKSNGEVHHGTQASTDDGLGSTLADEQPKGLASAVAEEQPNEGDLSSPVEDEHPNEDGLTSAVAEEQPNEDLSSPVAEEKTNENGLGLTEAVEQPIDGGIGSTAEDEQPDGGNLNSTGADHQPYEDKNKELNSLKLRIFDATTTVLGACIPLAAVGFGHENIGECPANLYLPYMVFIIGLLSFFIVGYAIVTTDSDDFNGLQENERMVIELSFRSFACLWFCELVVFYFTEVSFDSSADNYCDYSFHSFTIFMNIFAALALLIGSCLLYDSDVLLAPNPNGRATKTPRDPRERCIFESSDSE